MTTFLISHFNSLHDYVIFFEKTKFFRGKLIVLNCCDYSSKTYNLFKNNEIKNKRNNFFSILT